MILCVVCREPNPKPGHECPPGHEIEFTPGTELEVIFGSATPLRGDVSLTLPPGTGTNGAHLQITTPEERGIDWTAWVDPPAPGSLWVLPGDEFTLFLRYVGPERAESGEVFPLALVGRAGADPFWVTLTDRWRDHWRAATWDEHEMLKERAT